MAFEAVAKSVAKPVAKAAGGVFSRIAKAIKTPAVPEAVARGTAESPAILDEALAREAATVPAERAASVPYAGSPELKSDVRATMPEPDVTIEDVIQDVKSVTGALFRRDPNIAKDQQKRLYEGAWKSEAARDKADQMWRQIYKPIQSDPVNQAAKMHDYLILADENAQALRSGKTSINGKPIEQWQADLGRVEKEIAGDIEITETIKRRRELWDTVFDDMTKRGWITPDRYLEDYTPIRKIHAVMDGLARQGGEEFRSKLLDAQFSRTGAKGKRETNLLLLEHDLLEEYIRKVAHHETFIDMIADRTINLTEHFKPGDVVPPNLAVLHPGSGMMGHMAKTTEGDVLDGMVQEMRKNHPELGKTLMPGSYVFPKEIANALMTFNRNAKMTREENALVAGGRSLAKWLTVYNPANTRLNMVSDLMLAMSGLPGERAQPVGILTQYGKGMKAAYEIAFTNKNPIIEINGQKLDVRALIENEGISGSTLYQEVSGQKISAELARLLPEAERHNQFVLFDVLSKDRLATELAPRIAAGLDAFKRTGDIKEFGRVGREITLTYGAGAPKASRIPMVRIMSPFLQFVGLASGRVFDLLRAPESRNRALVGIMAVPLTTWMWNTRNPEFKKVEDALSPYERDQAHVILPDFSDPTKPALDLDGKPVVLRFRYSVPEEVMKLAGMGNIVSRADRVRRGRDTIGEFGKSIPTNIAKNLTETATFLPGLISDMTQEETATGKKVTWADKLQRVLPLSRIPMEAYEAGRDHGVQAGAMKAGQEFLGLRQANPMRRGSHLSDADMVIARKKVSDARRALRRALLNEGKTAQENARADFQAATEELKRVADVLGEERRAGEAE